MAYQAKAIHGHQAAPYGKLNISQGEVLQVEQRPSEWPGWVWVTTTHKTSGWMPLAYLQETESGWQSQVEYRDVELNVQPGDELEVLSTQSGWGWCRNPNNLTGWAPLNILNPLINPD